MYLGYSDRVYAVLLRLTVPCCEYLWKKRKMHHRGRGTSAPNGPIYIPIIEGRGDGQIKRCDCVWACEQVLQTTLSVLVPSAVSYLWQQAFDLPPRARYSSVPLDKTSGTFHDLARLWLHVRQLLFKRYMRCRRETYTYESKSSLPVLCMQSSLLSIWSLLHLSLWRVISCLTPSLALWPNLPI